MDFRSTLSSVPPQHQGQPDLLPSSGGDLSARTEVETMHAETHQFLQSTLDALTAHICVLDERGEILTTNAAWNRFAEGGASDPVRRAWKGVNYLSVCDSVTGPEQGDAAAFAAGIRAVMEGRKEEHVLEYACPTPTRELWFIGRATRFAASAPARVVVAHEDITERKLAERALRDSEARLQAILDQTPALIYAFDLQGRMTLCNRHTAEQLGLPAGALLGKRRIDLMPADHAQAHDANDQLVARTGRPLTTEGRHERPDGQRTFVSTKFPLRDACGVTTSICGVSTDTTELKHAQARLADSEGELRDLIEHMRVGLVAHGPDSAVLFANPRATELLGLSSEAMEARKSDDDAWYFLRSDGTRMPLEEYPVSQALASDDARVERLELGICRPDRETPIWVQCDAYPLRGPDGQLKRIMVTIFEITERKVAEERLRERDALYASVLAALREGLVVQDLEDKVMIANPSAASILGLTLDQLMGKSSFDPRWRALREDGTPLLPEEHPSVVTGRTGRPVDNFVMSVEVGGEGRRTLSVNSRPVLDAELKRTAVVTTLRDMTDQRHVEESLTQFAMVVEQASETILITDLGGAIVYVNPAFERSSGYAAAEALGKNPRFLQSGKHDQPFYQKLWDTIEGGQTWRGRIVNKHKSGRLYTEESSISPVRDAGGRLRSYVAVKRDITHNIELESQLLQAQKMEGIGRLAGGIAHDFNNLLSVILNYSAFSIESLREGDPMREDVQEIKRAAERAASLTRQILAFSRKQVLQPEPLELNRLLGEMEKMLQRVIGEDIRLILLPDPSLGWVVADPGQIDQVMMNLAVNARDAMPQGGTLTISTANVEHDADYLARHPTSEAGPHVRVTIADSGTGMDAATAERIFEPFFTTKGVGHGTGLGLSTVYGIVKQSGGYISVASALGRGTTFEIDLPRQAEPLKSGAGAPRDEVSPAASETVLVVDDNAGIRKLTHRILKTAGYTVLEAANGGEALLLSEQHADRIDLVLTDVVMPLLGGRALVERLSAARPGLRALYMSGYSDDAVANHGDMGDHARFLAKPFSAQDLLQKTRETLDAPHGPRPPASRSA